MANTQSQAIDKLLASAREKAQDRAQNSYAKTAENVAERASAFAKALRYIGIDHKGQADTLVYGDVVIALEWSGNAEDGQHWIERYNRPIMLSNGLHAARWLAHFVLSFRRVDGVVHTAHFEAVEEDRDTDALVLQLSAALAQLESQER